MKLINKRIIETVNVVKVIEALWIMRISNVKVNVRLWKVTKVRIRIRWIVQTLRSLLSLENFVRYKSEGKTMNMKIISSLSTAYNCKIKRNTWNISARRSRCSLNKNDIFGLSVVVSVEISRDRKFDKKQRQRTNRFEPVSPLILISGYSNSERISWSILLNHMSLTNFIKKKYQHQQQFNFMLIICLIEK